MTSAAAIILAGGSGRRMGSSKALLMHEKKTFIAHLEEQTRTACDPLYISSSDQQLDRYGDHRFADEIRDRGPLEGLRTCITNTRHSCYLFCAVDMPQLSSPFLKYLLSEYRNEKLLVPMEKKQMPLIGICNREIINYLENYLASKRYDWKGFTEYTEATLRPVPPQYLAPRNALLNINDPEQYAQWRKSASR